MGGEGGGRGGEGREGRDGREGRRGVTEGEKKERGRERDGTRVREAEAKVGVKKHDKQRMIHRG